MKREEEKTIYTSIEEYRSNGVCVVKGLLTQEEVRLLQEESLRLWSKQEDLTVYNLRVGLRKDLDGKDILERIDPVIDISKVFSDLNEDARIIKLAQDALGEPVCVLKEKLIYKWPGSSGYGTHRDAPYLSVSKEGPNGRKIVSVAVALDKIASDNGAIKFYPDLRFTKLLSPKEEPRDIDDAELKNIPFLMPDLNPGDIVLFDGIIPHNSGFNRSDRSRRIYFITFVPKRYIHYREEYYHFRQKELCKVRKKEYKGDFYIK